MLADPLAPDGEAVAADAGAWFEGLTCMAGPGAGAADGGGVSLGNARLSVLPEEPNGRTFAVQSVSAASLPALGVPEATAGLALAGAALRSTTGAMPPLAQPASNSTAPSITQPALLARIGPAQMNTNTAAPPSLVSPARPRRAIHRNGRAAARSRAYKESARRQGMRPRS